MQVQMVLEREKSCRRELLRHRRIHSTKTLTVTPTVPWAVRTVQVRKGKNDHSQLERLHSQPRGKEIHLTKKVSSR